MAKRPKPRPLTLVSLFTGAGGLDIGLEAAGFEHRLCVEVDTDCRTTISRNRPHWPLSTPYDITQLRPGDILRQAGLRRSELVLLAGGPPCTPFSKAGFWWKGQTDRLRDPRAKTLTAYLRAVEETLPRVVLLENVRGLVYREKDEGFRYLVHGLRKINARHGTSYQLQKFVVNAADFGIPQLRERVIMVACRGGEMFSLPDPTHGGAAGLPPYITCWDAIGDLVGLERDPELEPRGKWAKLLQTIPEGHNYLWHTSRGGGKPLFGWRTRYWSFLLKLARSQPSWTIPANPGPATGPFHWDSRLLSTRELCRLQTFPDTYQIYGNRRSAHRQIGNAVPCALGELLGKRIRAQVVQDRVSQGLSLLPQRRPIATMGVKIAPVPQRFLFRLAHHPPHPGEGLGPGALKRRNDGDALGNRD